MYRRLLKSFGAFKAIRSYKHKKTQKKVGRTFTRLRPSVKSILLFVLAAVSVVTVAPISQVQAAGVSNSALKWTTQATTAGNGNWQSVTYSPELGRFVAVANFSSFPTATNRRIMWSNDGKNWVLASPVVGSITRPVFTSVTWSPSLNLFVTVMCTDSVAATCASGAGNTIVTSPDGDTWTQRTSPDATSTWRSITWGAGKFVAVADLGTNQVMASTDGINWTTASASEASAWRSVTYSPSLGLFVAVATSGTNRVMTSPDGITWTSRTAAEANSWTSVTWAAEKNLFVAVSTDGTNRVMTSPDGITWTPHAASAANTWRSVTWSAELDRFVAVAETGTDRVMYSSDGSTWTGMPSASDNGWSAVVWAPEKHAFVAVAASNTASTRAMTGAMITATTNDASNIAARSATLNGDYQDAFVGSNVNVFFRYRIAGSSDPFTETTPQPITNAGAFTANITGLTADNTTYEYKAVVQWPSNGGTQTLEGGLKTFTTQYADDDDDSISNVIEDAAPNSGDANNDGTQDSTQGNVASFVNAVTGKYAALVLDSACQITVATVKAESQNAITDLLYDYPVGMMNFSADCGTPGFTTAVQQYYFNASGSGLVARKYNPNNSSYIMIDGANVASQTIGSDTATLLSFTMTDGGSLDTDGAEDGIIIDPAGLAVAVSGNTAPTPGSSESLANTGQNITFVALIAACLFGLGIALAMMWQKLGRKQFEL